MGNNHSTLYDTERSRSTVPDVGKAYAPDFVSVDVPEMVEKQASEICQRTHTVLRGKKLVEMTKVSNGKGRWSSTIGISVWRECSSSSGMKITPK